MMIVIRDQSLISVGDVVVIAEHPPIPRIGDSYRTSKGLSKVVDVIWDKDLKTVDIYVDKD